MTPYQLRYLQVLYRNLAGPVQHLAADAANAHRLKAMAGVMARLIAGAEAQRDGSDDLKAAARAALPAFEHLLAGNAALDALKVLLGSVHDDVNAYEAAIARLLEALAEVPGEARAGLLETLVVADHGNWSRIEALKAQLLSRPLPASDAASAHGLCGREAQVSAWLREACDEAETLHVSGMKLVPGGFSKQTLFLSLAGARHLPADIVLRLDRPESPLQTTVVAEYPLLETLHAAGVRVPRPLALDREAVAGAPLMAVERRPGRVVADGQHFLEAEVPFACAISLARQMAAYHRIPMSELPATLPGRDASVIDNMAAELDKLRAIWRESGHAAIAVEAAFIWLRDHLHYAGTHAALVHGDLRFHNVLVDGDEVSAILDWEIAAAGHPGFDLGYVYGHVLQLGSWPAFLRAYAAAGGEIPSADTLHFYIVRTELFIVVYLTRMAAAFQAGAFEQIELGYAAIELRQHALFLLADRLRKAMAGDPP